MAAPPPTPPGDWATDRLAQVDPRTATPIDVRQVNDRRNLARLTASGLEVRCGGTAGGCLGMFAGFIVGGYLGAAAGGVAPILLVPLFVVIGMFAGMRIALGLMSR